MTRCTPDHVITHCMGMAFPKAELEHFAANGVTERFKKMLQAIREFEAQDLLVEGLEPDHYPPALEAQYTQLRSELLVLNFLHSLTERPQARVETCFRFFLPGPPFLKLFGQVVIYKLKLFAHYLFCREGLEAFYVFWGITAGNGKGSTLKLLRLTLGGYFHDPDFATLAASRSRSTAGPDPSTMAFRGRRTLFVADTDPAARLDTYKVKTYSEGDNLIKARNL